jgi:hypothetical protein
LQHPGGGQGGIEGGVVDDALYFFGVEEESLVLVLVVIAEGHRAAEGAAEIVPAHRRRLGHPVYQIHLVGVIRPYIGI